MTPRKKSRVRRPRDTEVDFLNLSVLNDIVIVEPNSIKAALFAEEARELAAWLLKAAEYIEQREGE